MFFFMVSSVVPVVPANAASHFLVEVSNSLGPGWVQLHMTSFKSTDTCLVCRDLGLRSKGTLDNSALSCPWSGYAGAVSNSKVLRLSSSSIGELCTSAVH